MIRRSRWLPLLVLLVAVTGCYMWREVPEPPSAYFAAGSLPDSLRLTLADGTRTVVRRVRLSGDSLVAEIPARFDPLRTVLGEIRAVEVQTLDRERTVLFSGGLVVGIIVGLRALGGWLVNNVCCGVPS